MIKKCIIIFCLIVLSKTTVLGAPAYDRNEDRTALLAREKSLVKQWNQIIERRQGDLVVKYQGKTQQIIKQDPVPKMRESYYQTVVEVYTQSTCVLVRSLRMAYWYYIMVDFKSGKMQNLSGYPVWSPSFQKFVVLHEDIDGEGNAIQIWAKKPNGFIKEWESSNQDLSGLEAKWIDDQQVKIITNVKKPGLFNEQPITGPILECKFGKGIWQCQETAEHICI
jgi:hypothetical protein